MKLRRDQDSIVSLVVFMIDSTPGPLWTTNFIHSLYRQDFTNYLRDIMRIYLNITRDRVLGFQDY